VNISPSKSRILPKYQSVYERNGLSKKTTPEKKAKQDDDEVLIRVE
jgi:hypothetical protein